MWPRTDLLDLLGIDHPILQAPMGADSTAKMATAVCKAGGVGSLGCSYLSDDEIKQAVEEIRSATDGAINLNFFAYPEPREDPALIKQTQDRLAPFYEELGIDELPGEGEIPCQSFNESRLALVLELRPRIVSFHFGLPPSEMVHALQEAGCVILCSATTVAEARWLADAGVDAVIAQGWEAGGHRGTFDVSFEDFGVGNMALIPQIVDAVDVPVIAAGGIADGRGIAAALVLGASGVQMGSAFLSCPESNISANYRDALRAASADDSRLSRAYSGRPARARNNRYIEAIAEHRTELPAFPTMYRFSTPLGVASEDSGKTGFEFLLWGQAAALNRALPAAELFDLLVEEAQSALHHAGG